MRAKVIPYLLSLEMWTMHISSIQNNGQEVTDLKSEDLVDGLDLVNGADRRAHTSFLQAFEKLIQFDQIRFKCWRRINGNDYYAEIRPTVGNMNSQYQTLSYFIGEYESRPAKGRFFAYSDIPEYSWSWIDNKSSDSNLQSEERPYKNLVLGQNGFNFTFEPDSQQCFREEGGFVRFTVDVL